MPDLRDAIELMRLAHKKASTVHLVATIWGDQRLMEQAYNRWEATWDQEKLTAAPISAAQREGTVPSNFEQRYRVWTKRPGPRWRLESLTSGDVLRGVHIINGDRWWMGPAASMHTGTGAGSSGGEDQLKDLMDPRAAADVLQLAFAGISSIAGRNCYRLSGIAREHDEPEPYRRTWFYADEHELLIDSEYGLMLGYTAFFGGERLAGTTVESIEINGDIPDDLFTGPEDAARLMLPQ